MQQQQPKNEEKTIKKNIKSMKEQIKISIRFFLLKLICKQELRANVNIKVSLEKIDGISKKKKNQKLVFFFKTVFDEQSQTEKVYLQFKYCKLHTYSHTDTNTECLSRCSMHMHLTFCNLTACSVFNSVGAITLVLCCH